MTNSIHSSYRFSARACATALLAALLALPLPAPAQGPPPPDGQVPTEDRQDQTPPRLSQIEGEVSFWRPGAEDWSAAQLNVPLAPGDALYGGDRASFELQIGGRAFLRGGSDTQVGLENQEPDYLQFNLTSGHGSLDLRALEPGETVELDTPNAAFIVEATGYYRIDVDENTTTFVARRGGHATVTIEGGAPTDVPANSQVVVTGTDNPTLATSAAPDLDGWDRFNYDRTDHLSASVSAKYVPKEVYGAADLDQYGSWSATTQYGPVWQPRVAADWSPYSDGRWVWDPGYGWSWIDAAPWGWAPCHYGRWVHVHDHWGWAPGPIVTAPVYSPALVAFIGGQNFGVSVGIGAAAVGWVALGWGEPVVPWWGREDYIGHPSWHGWGGPRVVNNVVIKEKTVINVQNINVYQNTNYRNAVVASREDRFGRGGEHIRVRQVDPHRLDFVRGRVPVRPTAESLVARPERGRRPPEQVLSRRVVATRPPRDNAAVLRSEGLDVRKSQRPEPRIVSNPRGGRGGRAAGQPGQPGQPGSQPANVERERPGSRFQAQQPGQPATRERGHERPDQRGPANRFGGPENPPSVQQQERRPHAADRERQPAAQRQVAPQERPSVHEPGAQPRSAEPQPAPVERERRERPHAERPAPMAAPQEGAPRVQQHSPEHPNAARPERAPNESRRPHAERQPAPVQPQLQSAPRQEQRAPRAVEQHAPRVEQRAPRAVEQHAPRNVEQHAPRNVEQHAPRAAEPRPQPEHRERAHEAAPPHQHEAPPQAHGNHPEQKQGGGHGNDR